MRARFVNEFERGLDPKSVLDIGYAGKIHKFFDDLNIPRGDYNIEGKNIIFKKDLDLRNFMDLIELPDNLSISGELDLSNCTDLIKLGKNLNVRCLSLENCNKLTELSDNLKVGSCLFLYGCISLEKLPNNLKVGGNLYLNNTLIIELPDDLEVGGYIFIDNKGQEKLKSWILSSKYKNKIQII